MRRDAVDLRDRQAGKGGKDHQRHDTRLQELKIVAGQCAPVGGDIVLLQGGDKLGILPQRLLFFGFGSGHRHLGYLKDLGVKAYTFTPDLSIVRTAEPARCGENVWLTSNGAERT